MTTNETPQTDPNRENSSSISTDDANQDGRPLLREETEDAPRLRRDISFFSGVSLLVGSIIGSGIFASPSSVAFYARSTGLILVVWTVCGVITMVTAVCWCELGTMFPNACAEYSYIYEAFGEVPAFIFAFASIFVMKPAGLSILLLTSGDYIISATVGNYNLVYSKVVAAIFLGIILIINCTSVKWATRTINFFTATKIIAVIILLVTGVVRLFQGHIANFDNVFNGTTDKISDIGYAFYGGLWAFDGWNNLNYVTQELKDPIRELPLAIMVAIPFVTGCYVIVNIAYLTVMTSAEIAQSNAVAVTLSNQLYGVMSWVIPVLVACSTFGAANGSAFTGGRLVYAAANKGQMPKLLAMIHRKRHTPLPALIFTCIIAWLMLIPESSNFQTLVNYFNFAAWTFYGATVAALLWLRIRQPNLKRPYKVFIGIPVVALCCCVGLVAAPIYDYPLQSLYTLLFIFSGVFFYLGFVRYQILPDVAVGGFDSFTHKLQKFADLSMPAMEEDENGDRSEDG